MAASSIQLWVDLNAGPFMNFPMQRVFKVLPWIAGLLSLLFLLNAAGVISQNIGFFHDELWDFIPAVGMINADSIAGWLEFRIFGYPLPLVSGPYQGALKTWVSAPLLLITGTSPRTILAVNVLFSMVYLIALYWAILPVAGRKWAWLVFASPFVDTNFLLTAPMDTGPSLFQYVFISLALGTLFRFVSTSDMKWYRMTLFFSGCILAQKLTSIPVVIGFILLIGILSFRRFCQTLGGRQTWLAFSDFYVLPGLYFLVPMIPHLFYFYKRGFSALYLATADGIRGPYFPSLSRNFSFFRGMFDGTNWYLRITLERITASSPPILALSLLIALASALILYLACNAEKKYSKYAVLCMVLCIGSFLLYPLFRGLDRPWHLYILMPILISGSVISIACCLSYAENRSKGFAGCVLILFAAGLVFNIGFGSTHGMRMLRRIESRKGACITSPALNDVFRAIQSAHLRKLYVINYSLAYPIYVLSCGNIQVEDLYWADLTQKRMDEWFGKLRSNPEIGIAYRSCQCKEADPGWLAWMNREPQISEFIKRLEVERATLNVMSIKDDRQTEFFVISQDLKGASPSRRGAAQDFQESK
jgi:hypothetical protein